MSAFIVEQETIGFIVQAGISYGIIEREDALRTANMLWRENQKSIKSCYPNKKDFCKIGRFKSIGHLGTFKEFAPSQVRETINYFKYQSCEHNGWESSKSYCLIRIIRDKAMDRGGYKQGVVWGSPAPVKITRIKY